MPTKIRINKIILWFPLLLFLFNIWLKLLHLTTAAIGHDEPFSIYHAQFNLSTIVEELKNYNNPPLFEIILHFWIKLFGISPLSVRLLPAFFACLSPVILYYFAKRNFSIRVGITSSLLLTFSDLLIYYSHDCRVYSLLVLLSLLSFYYYLEVTDDKRRTLLKQILFIAFSTLVIYAHYFGVLILALQGLHLLLFNRKYFLKMCITYIVVLLLYLPYIFILLTRLGETSKGNWIEPPSGIESLYNMLWSFSNFPFITVTCIAILFFALIKVFVNKAYLRLKENSSTILVLLWFLIPYLGMFFVSYHIPMYISRYLIFALPAYYILVILCVENLILKNLYCNLVLAVLVLCFAFTNELNPDKKQPIFEAIKIIKQNKDSTTLVIVCTNDFVTLIAYHYNRTFFSSIADGKEYHLTDSLLRADNIYCIYNPDDLKSLLLMGKFNRVLYLGLDANSNAPNYPLINTLNSLYSLVKQDELSGGDWYIHFYNKDKNKDSILSL